MPSVATNAQQTSALFENAIDSLEVGISHFLLRDEYENALKYAIIDVYRSIELLLKEALGPRWPDIRP